MSIAGASQFLNSATLANQQGRAAVSPTLLGGSGLSPTSLLDAGRRDTGIGLSSRARQQTQQFLSATSSGFNQIFSLSGVEFGTTETLQQAILALRASVPESALSREVREDLNPEVEPGENVDIEV